MPIPISGITDLATLLANLEPVLNPGEFVFTTVIDPEVIPRERVWCMVREMEGITLIITKEDALHYNLPFEYVAAWITLHVHSSLEAVGLTAAFSNALSRHGISCNVVAGYFHDHIFVDQKHVQQAMEVLRALSRGAIANEAVSTEESGFHPNGLE